MGPWGTKYHFWQSVLIKKMPESSDSMCSFIFLTENIYHNFSEFTKIVNFVLIYFQSPGTHNLNKDHNLS